MAASLARCHPLARPERLEGGPRPVAAATRPVFPLSAPPLSISPSPPPSHPPSMFPPPPPDCPPPHSSSPPFPSSPSPPSSSPPPLTVLLPPSNPHPSPPPPSTFLPPPLLCLPSPLHRPPTPLASVLPPAHPCLPPPSDRREETTPDDGQDGGSMLADVVGGSRWYVGVTGALGGRGEGEQLVSLWCIQWAVEGGCSCRVSGGGRCPWARGERRRQLLSLGRWGHRTLPVGGAG